MRKRSVLPPETRLFIWNTNYFRRFGGAERAVHNLLNRFCELGFETYLIAQQTVPSRQHNEFFGPLDQGVKIYQEDFVNPWDSSNGPLGFIPKLLRYLKASFHFGAFIRGQRPQIIHLHYVSWDVLLLAFYKLFYRYRLVITFRAGEDLIARQRYLSRLKIRLALRTADHVTTISNELRETIETTYSSKKVLYIPNGIDVDQVVRSAQPHGGIESDQFVFCGRMTHQKRVDLLVDAFNECIKRGCRKKLYLVGDGEELEDIRNRIHSYGIQYQIVLLGALTHDQTLGVMSQSRCLLMSSAFEGLPQVALEAMALGKAIISSDVGGLRDIVMHGKSGYLYPVNRQDLFCAHLMELCQDDAKAQAFGRAGLARLKADYDLDRVVEQYLDLYQSLMAGSAAVSNRSLN